MTRLAVLGVSGLMVVMGAAGDSQGLPAWAQVLIGIAGFVGVATKQLVPGWMYTDLKAEKAQLQADKDKLITTLLDQQPKVMTALEASNNLVTEMGAEMRVMRRNQ